MRKIFLGQIRPHPMMCCGPGHEGEPTYQNFEDLFAFFFGEDGEGTLLNAIDGDVSAFGIGPFYKLWSLCWPHIVERDVLHRFSRDCLERTLGIWEEFHPGDDQISRAVLTAAMNAEGRCTPEELDAIRQEISDRIDIEPTEGCCALILKAALSVMTAEPGGGAINCVVQIPEAIEVYGVRSKELESEAQLSIFRARCEQAGYFATE